MSGFMVGRNREKARQIKGVTEIKGVRAIDFMKAKR